MQIDLSGNLAVFMPQTARDHFDRYALLHEEAGVCMTQCMGCDWPADAFYGILLQVSIVRIIVKVSALILEKQITAGDHAQRKGIVFQAAA